MAGRLLTIFAVLFLMVQAEWAQGGQLNDISRIVYTSDAGSILPELQWHERITITAGTVELARNGRTPDTKVNAGTWEFPVDPGLTRALFDQLGAVDAGTIRRVEPEDPPDGGGTEAYGITWAGKRELWLTFDPGVTYTNAERIVGPIKAFIRDLPIPAQARTRDTLK